MVSKQENIIEINHLNKSFGKVTGNGYTATTFSARLWSQGA